GEEAEVHLFASRDEVTAARSVARVVASEAAVLSSFLLATPAGPVGAGEPIEFVLSGSNVGAFDAYAATDPLGVGEDGILITADVPDGLTFFDAEFSAGAGAGTLYYFDGSSWSTSPGPVVERIALLLQGADGFFVQGAAYELRYTVYVANGGGAGAPIMEGDPLAGDTFLSSGRVVYATSVGGENETATSNTVQNTVKAAYDAEVGPFGLTTGDYDYDGRTISRGSDVQAIALAHAGNRVSFRNTVRNAGHAADSFALALSGVPVGWMCGTYAADGATPAPTVRPIAPLATAVVVVRCQVPADGATDQPPTVTLTSTSVTRPAATDATTNTVSEVASGYAVTFLGEPTTVSGEAGSSVTFDLTILNG